MGEEVKLIAIVLIGAGEEVKPVVCARREGWGNLELTLIQVARLPNEKMPHRI